MTETIITEAKSFRDFVVEGMRTRGLTPNQLIEVTDIAPSYVRAILDEQYELLPAAPYVRGYVKKLADALRLDFETLWEQYQREADIKQAGQTDRLPTNRFALPSFSKRRLLLTLVVIIALAIAIPRVADFLGAPVIEVRSPSANNITTTSDRITLEGWVENLEDKVLINDQEITVGADGVFRIEVPLERGINMFTFSAQRFLGRKNTVERTVIYAPPLQPEPKSQLQDAGTPEKSDAILTP